MKEIKLSLNLKEGLSIRELEERYELTVAAGTGEELFEIDKPRCGKGHGEPEIIEELGY